MAWDFELPDVSSLPEWQVLDQFRQDMIDVTLRELFAADPERADTFTFAACGLTVDFSKNFISKPVFDSLLRVAESMRVSARRDAMFDGDRINTTEDRSVLHIALRRPENEPLSVDGGNVVSDVHKVLARMNTFASSVRDGSWRGFTGERIRTVINIGIGGSDLGPVMAYEALRFYSDRNLDFRFVSNVDPAALYEALHGVDPRSALFIVASKTFTTLETMTNAMSARSWLIDALGDVAAVRQHFAAVSSNEDKVVEFGISPENMFGFWDWVGGRYSMDSAIGLSTMIAVGYDEFCSMLDGFHDMDQHFLHTPLSENIPVIHGLVSVWYRNFLDCQTHAVLPYSQYLSRFPAYLQQLTMESNGKSVVLNGSPVSVATGPIYWGEPGTNGQHSFYQLLHQGTTIVPVDFIGFAQSLIPNQQQQQDLLMSNIFAQAQALAFGKTARELLDEGVSPALVPHKVMPGNRPSTTVLGTKLTPYMLGVLIAMYEHSVFVQGAVWNINSFDQWGVELGKVMAQAITPELSKDAALSTERDSSTNALIRQYRSLKS
jgi:glucose-6-phosphate isomerase